MTESKMYTRHRFPLEIIQYAVWLYHRFSVSHRDIEDLLAQRGLLPEVIHNTQHYASNRAELSHQPTRVRERGMRKFKSVEQAQRFLSAHASIDNLFNLGRHLVSAENYRYFRLRAFASSKNAAIV